jgi:hypothetical protein
MPYLIPREVVELLLHCHHPIQILKCFLYRGDLVGLLGGLLGVAVLGPHHLPCLDYWHVPLDHCPPLEVAHLLDPHHLELDPHLGLVEMLALRKMVDLVLMEALRIP